MDRSMESWNETVYAFIRIRFHVFQELSPGVENYHVLRLAPCSLSRMSRHVNHHVPLTRFDVNCKASCAKWTWRDNRVKTWDIRPDWEGVAEGEHIKDQAWLRGDFHGGYLRPLTPVPLMDPIYTLLAITDKHVWMGCEYESLSWLL